MSSNIVTLSDTTKTISIDTFILNKYFITDCKLFILNYLHLSEFCEDFANFVYWYANTGSCNKT